MSHRYADVAILDLAAATQALSPAARARVAELEAELATAEAARDHLADVLAAMPPEVTARLRALVARLEGKA